MTKRNRDGALPPGQWEEMRDAILQVTDKFLPGRNGDVTAGMAKTIRSVLWELWSEREMAVYQGDKQHEKFEECRASGDTEKQQQAAQFMLNEAYAVTAYNKMLHKLYYGLVENHVIKTY